MENYEDKVIAYDLRQTYAQLLTMDLFEIQKARYEKKFDRWFDFLESLYTNIHQKLSEGEKKNYIEMRKRIVETLIKFQAAFLGSSSNPTQRYMIFAALKELECWLRDAMEAHNLFGFIDSDEGL